MELCMVYFVNGRVWRSVWYICYWVRKGVWYICYWGMEGHLVYLLMAGCGGASSLFANGRVWRDVWYICYWQGVEGYLVYLLMTVVWEMTALWFTCQWQRVEGCRVASWNTECQSFLAQNKITKIVTTESFENAKVLNLELYFQGNHLHYNQKSAQQCNE